MIPLCDNVVVYLEPFVFDYPVVLILSVKNNNIAEYMLIYNLTCMPLRLIGKETETKIEIKLCCLEDRATYTRGCRYDQKVQCVITVQFASAFQYGKHAHSSLN